MCIFDGALASCGTQPAGRNMILQASRVCPLKESAKAKLCPNTRRPRKETPTAPAPRPGVAVGELYHKANPMEMFRESPARLPVTPTRAFSP